MCLFSNRELRRLRVSQSQDKEEYCRRVLCKQMQFPGPDQLLQQIRVPSVTRVAPLIPLTTHTTPLVHSSRLDLNRVIQLTPIFVQNFSKKKEFI